MREADDTDLLAELRLAKDEDLEVEGGDGALLMDDSRARGDLGRTTGEGGAGKEAEEEKEASIGEAGGTSSVVGRGGAGGTGVEGEEEEEEEE